LFLEIQSSPSAAATYEPFSFRNVPQFPDVPHKRGYDAQKFLDSLGYENSSFTLANNYLPLLFFGLNAKKKNASFANN